MYKGTHKSREILCFAVEETFLPHPFVGEWRCALRPHRLPPPRSRPVVVKSQGHAVFFRQESPRPHILACQYSVWTPTQVLGKIGAVLPAHPVNIQRGRIHEFGERVKSNKDSKRPL